MVKVKIVKVTSVCLKNEEKKFCCDLPVSSCPPRGRGFTICSWDNLAAASTKFPYNLRSMKSKNCEIKNCEIKDCESENCEIKN